MQEIELKLQIPAGALDAVRAELARLAAIGAPASPPALPPPLILQAAYFDTPDRHLAQARSALRVRREGDEWVQTLKAAGSHTMLRVEDNRAAPATAPGEVARPDLGLHALGPAESALRQALGWDPATDPHGEACGLVALYRTDMRRTRVRLDVAVGTPQAGTVELALDEGEIAAGEGASRQTVPVRELEIELLGGHPQAVIQAARPWVQGFGLWLDTQTKAHRGDRLARQASTGQIARPQAQAPRWPRALPGTDGAQKATRATEACLAHLTAHLSELAGLAPDTPGTEAVARQWSRGLRRLRALGVWVGRASTASCAPDVTVAGAQAQSEAIRALQAAAAAASDLMRPLTRSLDAGDLATAIQLARSEEATEACLQVLTALTSEG